MDAISLPSRAFIFSGEKGPPIHRVTSGSPQRAGARGKSFADHWRKPRRDVRRKYGFDNCFSLTLAVLKFFVPGHLDGFEFAFVRLLGIARKAGKRDHPFVEIGKADSERVRLWI